MFFDCSFGQGVRNLKKPVGSVHVEPNISYIKVVHIRVGPKSKTPHKQKSRSFTHLSLHPSREQRLFLNPFEIDILMSCGTVSPVVTGHKAGEGGMNIMTKVPGIVARGTDSGEKHRLEQLRSAFDTKTARVAHIIVDKAGALKKRCEGHSWILLVQQKPGELIPQIGGGTYREEAFIKCPGGGVEPGETLAEAASREMYQEAGLCIPLEALDIDFSMEFQAASRRVDFQVPVGEHIAHWNTFFLHVTAQVPKLPLVTNDPKEIERVMLIRIRDINVLKKKGKSGTELAPSHRMKLAELFRQDKCLRLLRFAGVDETDIGIMQRLRK